MPRSSRRPLPADPPLTASSSGRVGDRPQQLAGWLDGPIQDHRAIITFFKGDQLNIPPTGRQPRPEEVWVSRQLDGGIAGAEDGYLILHGWKLTGPPWSRLYVNGRFRPAGLKAITTDDDDSFEVPRNWHYAAETEHEGHAFRFTAPRPDWLTYTTVIVRYVAW